MPRIRPFRALRYSAEAIDDLGLVVCPPYDVIDAPMRERLIERHPRNAVRLDMPDEAAGDDPDDRYRRVARTLAEWRSDGTLRKDPRPALYACEQTYRIPGTEIERIQRGFFGRLALEPYGPGGSVLPHERTLAGPREDRYKLLRATGLNTSPVVTLFDDPAGVASGLLADVAGTDATIDVTDDDGTRNRLWILPQPARPDPDLDESPESDSRSSVAPSSVDPVAALLAIAQACPVTIADGHHRYETALRYRDERRMSRSCEEDPAFDYLLALMVPTDQPLTVLATHRIVRRLGEARLAALRAQLDDLFEVREVSPDELVAAFGSGADGGADGAIGLWIRGFGALLKARPAAFAPILAGGPALQRLDVVRLGAALDRLAGINATAVAEGRLGYTKSAADAIARVDAREDSADAAFLLAPPAVADVVAAATDGEVLPQKSTYFYPKALTGLVFNPLEW